MTLALFDLDNTLLAGDSDYLWGEFLVDNDLVDGEEYRLKNQQFYHQYRAGKLDIHEFLRFSLAPLARIEPAELHRLRSRFMTRCIEPLIEQSALDLVSQHIEQGHVPVIITATNRFVTEPIAHRFGIPNLIATEPARQGDRYTGDVEGVPCFQAGKIERLNTWLDTNDNDLAGSWFYSDSHNDLPLLKCVENPVAVDPDPTLEQHAREMGWPVISLRS